MLKKIFSKRVQSDRQNITVPENQTNYFADSTDEEERRRTVRVDLQHLLKLSHKEISNGKEFVVQAYVDLYLPDWEGAFPATDYGVRVYMDGILMKNIIIESCGECCLKSEYADEVRRNRLQPAINLAEFLSWWLQTEVVNKSQTRSLTKHLKLVLGINGFDLPNGFVLTGAH